MSTKLSDLRMTAPCSGLHCSHHRPATTADLVEALIAEGGEIRESYWVDDPGGQFVAVTGFSESDGRYLVFPIPAEEETT